MELTSDLMNEVWGNRIRDTNEGSQTPPRIWILYRCCYRQSQTPRVFLLTGPSSTLPLWQIVGIDSVRRTIELEGVGSWVEGSEAAGITIYLSVLGSNSRLAWWMTKTV